MVKILIKHGADVNIKDINGNTALDHAIENKEYPTIYSKELIDYLSEQQN